MKLEESGVEGPRDRRELVERLRIGLTPPGPALNPPDRRLCPARGLPLRTHHRDCRRGPDVQALPSYQLLPSPRAVRASLSLLCAELRGDEPPRKRSKLGKSPYTGLQSVSSVCLQASALTLTLTLHEMLGMGTGCEARVSQLGFGELWIPWLKEMSHIGKYWAVASGTLDLDF